MIREALPFVVSVLVMFAGWVASEFGWDRKQISRFIQVATEFSNVTTLGHFDKSALYLLAAPSVPEAARDEAKAKASNGRVSHRAAKEIVAKHKPVEPQPVVRPVAPVAVVVPTFDQVFAAIPSIHRKRLDSLPGIKNSARVLYAATLDLCGYNAVVGNG